MSINAEWDTPAQAAIRLDFDGKWTWLDFDYVMNQAADLSAGADYQIHLILNLTHAGPLAAGAVMEQRELRKSMGERRGALIVVGDDSFAHAIMNILTRVYEELGEEYFVVSDLEQARLLAVTPEKKTA